MVDIAHNESGLPVRPVYTGSPATGPGPEKKLGAPGRFPYTRGVYPTMYTSRPWTTRQYAGFGTAQESNARYHEARSSSWRSTPVCRSSTRSPRRSPVSTWCARCSGSPTARSSATATRCCAGTPSSSVSTARTPAATSARRPAPGTVTTFEAPSGPGVRLDAGVEAGSVIGPAWDSLLAKLIVTGRTRKEALQRAARTLEEFRVEGMATALPFHRAVVVDPDFTADPFRVHTRWIETEFVNEIKPFAAPADAEEDEETGRETLVVEVGGKRLEVSLPSSLGMSPARTGLAVGAKPKRRAAKKSGTVKGLTAEVGASLTSGAPICEIKD